METVAERDDVLFVDPRFIEERATDDDRVGSGPLPSQMQAEWRRIRDYWRAEVRQYVGEAVARHGSRDAIVMMLDYFDFKQVEIAKITGLPRQTIQEIRYKRWAAIPQ